MTGAVLLLLATLLCACPIVSSYGYRRQLHNVWYNGLLIGGVAVDEDSGDVFFSDAVGNRVIHQSAQGLPLATYRAPFYSPMQLAWHNGELWVANSHNNSLVIIDVHGGGRMRVSSTPSQLSSCTAFAFNNGTGSLFAVDGWGLTVQVYEPELDQWAAWLPLWTESFALAHIGAVAAPSSAQDAGPVWIGWAELEDAKRTGRRVSQPAQSISYQLAAFSAAQFYPNDSMTQVYTLLQPKVDGPMYVFLLGDSGSQLVQSWESAAQGGKAVPFFGGALYVDTHRAMYLSDHGVDERSPYGRVVKLAPNGSELAQWSVSDGVVYAFSSIWHVDATTVSSSCAYWVTDSERGVVRLAADGTVLLPFYDAPHDQSDDNRTARFTGVSGDDLSLVMLDTASQRTTKLWRFWLTNYTYQLLDTSSASLGPNVIGVAVDALTARIYVTDTRTNSVLRLYASGELDDTFSLSAAGLVQPAALLVWPTMQSLFVLDTAHYDGHGAIVQFNWTSGQALSVVNGTAPSLLRPLSMTADMANDVLYVAVSSGSVFEFGLDPPSTLFGQEALHQPLPAATNITSMTVGANGVLYMIDEYTRRLSILMRQPNTWDLGSDCIPHTSSISLSSSSSAASLTSTGSSSSPSSSASAPSASAAHWSASTIVGVVLAVLGVAAIGFGGSCYYVRCKRGQGRQWAGGSRAPGELHPTNNALVEGADVSVDEHPGSNVLQAHVVSSERDANETAPLDSSSRVLSLTNDTGTVREKRYEYYVARYEVRTAVRDIPQVEFAKRHESRLTSHPPSIHTPQQQLGGPSMPPTLVAQSSHSTTSTTSILSSSAADTPFSHSSSSSDSADHAVVPTVDAAADSAKARVAHTATWLSSPTHIAELQSAWSKVPTFIDSVKDLIILGEGSSGVVYRGTYRGVPCVVKLPKSVSITGAAWREWQCHLSLPAHAHLVRFLGALPMAATNYLVLSFVRQGSLHSLLTSPASTGAAIWYTRPYAVMRCLLDMSAVLAHMHSRGIVHRDISARNILVDSDGSYVLADLGLAAQLTLPIGPAKQAGVYAAVVADEESTAVPVRWTSPEALACLQRYDGSSDVWSLGVAMWEMTAGGALPYGEHASSTRDCIRPIAEGKWRLQVDKQWFSTRGGTVGGAEQRLADRVRQLIALCLTYDCEKRPDSAQLTCRVEQEWADWCVEAAGGEAARLQTEWEEWHDEVQRRLGEPVVHDDGWDSTASL